MNNNFKVLKLDKSDTIFDKINFKDDNFDIKNMFLNSVLNRLENYTQDEASKYLGVSRRTIARFEKGKVNDLVLTLNYINIFNKNFAKERLRISRIKFFKNKSK